MIKSRLEDLMWENRIKSINQLSLETGLSRQTLTALKDNTNHGVNLSTLETLCNYFNCEVGDILVMEEELQ